MAATHEVGVYNFSEIIKDDTVFFSVLRLKQSFLLWVGSEPGLHGLAVAMRIDSKEPTSVPLLGPTTDIHSSSLAQRLVKRTGCSQCFVSINIKNPSLIPDCEDAIIRQLDNDPTLFYIP